MLTPDDSSKMMNSIVKNWLNVSGKNRLNLKQLSRDTKVPTSTIWCYFSGSRKWSFSHFLHFSSYFGSLKVDPDKCTLQLKLPVSENTKRILKKLEVKK